MDENITWVALDAHKKKHAVAVLAPGKEIEEFAVPNEAKAIRRLARKLVREAVRDLVRCREDAKEDLLRARHRLSKFLLRRGHVYRLGSAWTQRHARWMSEIVWEHDEDQEVFDSYCLAISHREDQIRALDESIEAISQRDPYAQPVGWLRWVPRSGDW